MDVHYIWVVLILYLYKYFNFYLYLYIKSVTLESNNNIVSKIIPWNMILGFVSKHK